MIRGRSTTDVALMDRAMVDEYFEEYAGYMEDAPPYSKYVVRVGADFFYSGDTMELKEKLLKHWRKLRRRPIVFNC